jgi:hypothetical protein
MQQMHLKRKSDSCAKQELQTKVSIGVKESKIFVTVNFDMAGRHEGVALAGFFFSPLFSFLQVTDLGDCSQPPRFKNGAKIFAPEVLLRFISIKHGGRW